MQRLGRNIDRYLGETIDLAQVIGDCLAAARSYGWSAEDIPAGLKPNLIALTRKCQGPRADSKRIYISAGIHGDEPAGPLAVRQLLQESRRSQCFKRFWKLAMRQTVAFESASDNREIGPALRERRLTEQPGQIRDQQSAKQAMPRQHDRERLMDGLINSSN